MENNIYKLRRKLMPLKNALDEKQWRLLLGMEAKSLGHGGIRAVSKATGVEENTIRKGKREIEAGNHDTTRVRAKGAGRKSLREKDPTLIDDLENLVEPNERGDPMSPLRWTIRSTRILAEILKRKHHKTSHNTVKNLLHSMNFSLQANCKKKEGAAHPDRNAQFEHINKTATEYLKNNDPVISVDTKKKELVGDFKNNGRDWRPKGEPEIVRMHDFKIKELGKVAPYGIYDLGKNEGWVNVGIDHDTAQFSVESIRQWWKHLGKKHYPNSNKLFITADSGGSNSSRSRLWKVELQKFSNETGLVIAVSHFPPGTSKWNKIEHRLFSFISQNWRAKPLYNYATVINLIAATTTETGLKIYARLDRRTYQKGIKVTNEELERVNILKNTFHGEWNYVIKPNIKA